MPTNKGSIPYQFHFEREQGLSAENKVEKGGEGEGQSSEEQLSTERQIAALYSLKQDEFLKSLYGMEIDTSVDHFNIIFEGNFTKEEQSAFKMRQENDLMVICGYLKTSLPKTRINMHVFETRESKQEIDPHHSVSRASFRSINFTIYRVWDKSTQDISFPHEITHAVTHLWTSSYDFPVALDTADGQTITTIVPMVSNTFLQEGIAIAVDELAFGRKLRENDEILWPDEYLKKHLEVKTSLPTIQSMMRFEGFCNVANNIAVPMAASWVKYSIQTYGLEKFKEYYISITELMNEKEIEDQTKTIFGLDIDSITVRWYESLRKLST